MSGKTSMLEALHNRVLLKNTHKYVLKKVLTSQKEEWC